MRVESCETDLADNVRLQDVEIVRYSPAIESHVRAGLSEISLEEACRMMLSVSDNPAANIDLSEIGGPERFAAFLRSIGDQVTQLDRRGTAIKDARPGDLRDTTTPRLSPMRRGCVLALGFARCLCTWILQLKSRVFLRSRRINTPSPVRAITISGAPLAMPRHQGSG